MEKLIKKKHLDEEELKELKEEMEELQKEMEELKKSMK